MNDRSPASRGPRTGSGYGVALLATLAFASCKRHAPDELPPPEETTVAPDQIVSGEVAPSREELFGLALPAGLQLTQRLQFQGSAIGSVPFEAVANYVRSQIDAKNVETGPSSTVFESARVKAPRPDPEGKAYPPLVLRVVVKRTGQLTALDIWADVVVPDDAPDPERPARTPEPVAPPAVD